MVPTPANPRRGSTATASSRRPSTLRRQSSVNEALLTELSRQRSSEVSYVENIAVHEPVEHEQDLLKEVDEREAVGGDDEANQTPEVSKPVWPHSVRYLILMCALITSTSFGITQVPILYVFRLMTCDIYYEQHKGPDSSFLPTNGVRSVISYMFSALAEAGGPSPPPGNDRCAVHDIEASTALNIALLGASTTVFGIINLFWTGHLIKRIGLKSTLLLNVGFPACRLFVQNVGVEVWGSAGIIIVQLSQLLTIMGGPSGYILVLNSFITEVVTYEERTAALGKIAGSMMLGSAVGFLVGGEVADKYGIKAPFRMTMIAFLLSAAYVWIFLPHVPLPEPKKSDDSSSTEPKVNAIKKFLSPILVFTPKKFIRANGTTHWEYGTFLLAVGVFLAILATGYLPTLLQLYATDVFRFGTKENGRLIFMYSLLRGAFLTFMFPRIIAIGRKLTKEKSTTGGAAETEPSERDPLLATNSTTANTIGDASQRKEETFIFDLYYTRISICLDGLLTLVCVLAHKGWHMYVVAAILPFAAGTGSAAKGTVLQMVGSSASSAERIDALAGLSLLENISRLLTTFVFASIFAAFAHLGKHELTFVANAPGVVDWTRSNRNRPRTNRR